jgi:hypothetical protein
VCISNGSVRASANGEVVTVTVAASLLPLVLLAAVSALIVALSGLGTAWVVGVVTVLLFGNYLFVHFGLFLVADAVASAAPASRAA